MFNEIIFKFKALPDSLKNGIMFLFAGWIWYYISLYTNLLGEIPPRQLAVGLSVCFLIFMMIEKKKWARPLCILCNIFIIIQFVFSSIGFFNRAEFKLAGMTAVVVLFFSISSYYLAIKESSEFFKDHEKDKDSVKREPRNSRNSRKKNKSKREPRAARNNRMN